MRIVSVLRRARALPNARSGFTLPDLVITVLIIGILSAVAAPKFIESLHRMRVQAAAKRVQVDLRYARQTAIARSASLTVSFAPTTDAYSIAGLTALNKVGQTYAVALNESPYDTDLVSATLGGDSDIQFDRFGLPDSGGTITVESGGRQETVTVDPNTGKASIP